MYDYVVRTVGKSSDDAVLGLRDCLFIVSAKEHPHEAGVGGGAATLERALVQPHPDLVPGAEEADKALAHHGEAAVVAIDITVVQVNHIDTVHQDLDLLEAKRS